MYSCLHSYKLKWRNRDSGPDTINVLSRVLSCWRVLFLLNTPQLRVRLSGSPLYPYGLAETASDHRAREGAISLRRQMRARRLITPRMLSTQGQVALRPLHIILYPHWARVTHARGKKRNLRAKCTLMQPAAWNTSNRAWKAKENPDVALQNVYNAH